MAQASSSIRTGFKFHKHALLISLVSILLLFAVAVAVFESQLSQSVTSEVRSTLSTAGDQINLQVQEKIDNYRHDLRFLHATPPVRGLPRALINNGIDPFDSATTQQWKTRLESTFAAFLQSNSEYDQLRIISADERAMELVRVDRVDGKIEVVPPEHLQSKRNSEYAQKSAKLAPGEMYMSRITLNREFGKLDFPYRPMLRLSLPIFDDNGGRFGFLIVNINARKLLDLIKNVPEAPSYLIMTDSDGYFLVTPKHDHQYSRDLAPKYKWDTVFKHYGNLGDHFTQVSFSEDDSENYYVLSRKILVTGDVETGFLFAKLMAPESYVHTIEMQRRTTVYAFLGSITAIMLIVLSFFNRSARKSQQLADARAQSEAIVSASQDAIISVTVTGEVISWNYAAESLLELSAQSVMGNSLIELNVFDDVELGDIFDKLSNKDTQLTAETQIDSKEGSQRYLSLSFSSISNDVGEVKGIAIIARNVTNERIADDKIKQANAELEEKVALRTIELQKASRVKSAFISNISHEMRTPLNGIIGTLNLVKREPLTESQQRYIEMTEVSVNTLSTLVNDVLDLSKIEAGKLDLDFKSFNPINLIESLCGSMAVKAQEKGLEFVIDVSRLDCVSMVSDPHRFSQIMTNLVNNAIKFTEKGYIKVSAYTEQTDTGNVILNCAIEDSGTGIATENQHKLFSAFSQEDSSIASKHGGTGLGLSICRQLVTLLNGDVHFESEKNKGSTFYFSISSDLKQCKIAAPEQQLVNTSSVVLIEQDELYQSTCRMIETLGGNIIDRNDFTHAFAQTAVDTSFLPDYFVVDQQHPFLLKLDNAWTKTININNGASKVVLLKRDGEPTAWLENIKPTVLTKPILRSEFIQKMALLNPDEAALAEKDAERSNVQPHFDTAHPDIQKIKGARLLIVDDNEINIEVAKGILAGLPITLLQATNGKEALQQLILAQRRGEAVHCVLMDCQMPIMNGYETSQRIRKGEAGESYTNMPIIAMTANAMLGERNKCLSAGMSDYLTKPVNEVTMKEKVTKWTLSVYHAGQG
ncbi:Signal transduction histidine-protein kinase BarA [Paraglaciecola mesophila]|uniref:histidine kinase n=1 Tax=Paraglaciecola mesophila TaxID=197222 RepID=A0A857JGE0_9ALTE|nr:ATP-binding protein [Paraglaciecola mesophila]QHJ10258.1 Signal transduction histidine-protein kinase BarA [Paraglaciecola mesophila]